MNLAVVMPAYNAAAQIQGVLARLEKLPEGLLSRLIVVNDGSSDQTAQLALRAGFARSAVELVDRARNGGYGAAMKDGLAAAMRSGAELVACIHADGQYSPEALPGLIETLQSRKLDLLQGSSI